MWWWIFDGKNYSNKLYIGETGRWLGGRFQEHLRNIETNDKDASKAVTGGLISLIIQNNIWQFVAFPYTRLDWKAAKH